MARTQNTVFGRTSGSIGGVTCQTWKGVNVVRSKPFEVRQNVTPAVTLNRSKFSAVGSSVSKINFAMQTIYNFGIQKTTEFADTVKFFRSRILDTLKLDPALLKGAKFGTGNAEGFQYSVTALSVDQIQLTRLINSGDVEFESLDSKVSILAVSDDMKKIAFLTEESTGDVEEITFDISEFGFVAGDKVAFATKVVKFKAGADLAGKVKFVDTPTFNTLTA